MITSVADGYGVQSGYNFGYYRQLSPTWLRLVALSRGVILPPSETLRYFELGFGQGVSLNVHSAANSGEYWGNDYNPDHLAFAHQMAEASGANLHLLGDSFEQLAERKDLPQFDVIVAHGIWSWIADSTRAAILKFLDERLAPGGLFYISYNALPGAASGIAIQRLVHLITSSADATLTESERFEIARRYLREVSAEPGSHFDGYPKARERLDRILGGASPYLLHEYTVASWRPELACEVSAQLKQVGLEFCGSAYLDPKGFGQPRGEIAEAGTILQETLRDFRIDRAFRSDLFVRPLQDFGLGAIRKDLDEQLVALTAIPDEVEISPVDQEALGLTERLISLLEELGSGGPSRIVDLVRGEGESVGSQHDLSALCLALNRGLAHPVASDLNAVCRTSSERLDAFLGSTLYEGEQNRLRVSPVIGAAANLPDLEEALVAYANRPEKIMEWLTMRKPKHIGTSAAAALKYAVNFEPRMRVLQTLQVKLS